MPRRPADKDKGDKDKSTEKDNTDSNKDMPHLTKEQEISVVESNDKESTEASGSSVTQENLSEIGKKSGSVSSQKKEFSQKVYANVMKKLGLEKDTGSLGKIPKKKRQEKQSSKRKPSPLVDLHPHKKSKYHAVSSSEEEDDTEDEDDIDWGTSSEDECSQSEDSSEESEEECEKRCKKSSNASQIKSSEKKVDLSLKSQTDLKTAAGEGGGDPDPNNGAYAIFEEKLPKSNEGTAAPLPSSLSRLINAMWDKALLNTKSLDIDKLFDQYPRPENLDKVIMTDLNPEVQRSIYKKGRSKDIVIRSLQKPTIKVTYIIAYVLDQLVVLEDENTRLKIIDLLLDAVNMLGYLNAKIGNIRRGMIRPQLDFTYQVICDRPQPSHQWLFGDDLVRQLEDAVKAARVTRRIHKKKPHRFGRKKYHGYSKKPFLGEGFYTFVDDFHVDSTYDEINSTKNQLVNDLDMIKVSRLVDQEINTLLCSVHHDKIVTSHNQDIRSLDVNLTGNIDHNMTQQKCIITICRQEEQEGLAPKEKGQRQEQQLDDLASHSTQVGEYNNFWLQTKFKAGSLADHISFWYTMTSDKTILDLVKGVKLEFDDIPSQGKLPPEIRFGKQEQKFLDNKIEELLHSGVVEYCDHEDQEFISRIFLRPKKEGGSYRLILDLSDLNESITYRHFKMDSLDSALNLIKPGSYMASLDVQDSFFSIKVHPQSRKYLKFYHHDQLMCFTCMPQGLGCSPRIFTKLMKIPLSFVRQKYNYLSSPYVDDVFLAGDTKKEAQANVNVTGDVLQKSGYTLNLPKSQTDPGQTIDHVGFFISSVSMTVRLVDRKIVSIKNLIGQVMKSKSLKIRKFAKLIGTLVATLPANRYGPLFTKPLEISKSLALKNNGHDYDQKMVLLESDKECLDWWLHNLDTMYKPIITPDPQYTIFTDSSLEGWGFHDPQTGAKNGGKWPLSEQGLHINVLELKSIYISIQSCCKHLRNSHLRVMSDSSTAVHCVNNQGSTKSPECHQVAREIWFWCMERDLWISTAHIAGVLNISADEASRKFNDDIEWQLNDTIFDRIHSELGPCDIDLFASTYNHKLPVYCSWKPDPNCNYVDAFSITWKQFHKPYIFAPFSLVGKVMQKIIAENLQHALLVVPVWNTQHWFPLVSRQRISHQIDIPVRTDTLIMHAKKKQHPLVGKLTLRAILVSGQPIRRKDMQVQ